MKRAEISRVLQRAGIVAVLRKIPESAVIQVVEALVLGGIRALEVTLDSPGAPETISSLREKYDGQVTIGAGTIISNVQLDDAVRAGAEFLVCPHFDSSLLKQADTHQVPLVPGVLTPTEIQVAIQLGAEVIKVFPAGTMGTSYIKDLLGPFGDLKIMVTGGISEENAGQFLQAGAIAVGMGSSLFPKSDVEAGDWNSIANRARRLMTLVQNTVH